MEVAVFSTKPYDARFLGEANQRHQHALRFFEARLDSQTAPLAREASAVCAFVNDDLGRPVLEQLAGAGVRLIALRSAGFNNVDLPAVKALDLTVARVPAYSPHAVAEHTVGLILSLNRRLHKAYARVREGNFSLNGLCGFDVHGRTVGVIGTGRIGAVFAQIMKGFGCRVLAFDPMPDETLDVEYTSFERLLEESDIISLHCPLTKETKHLIDNAAIHAMKPGVMLINTSRGALVDTPALIAGLKSGRIGALGLDVYEEEEKLFFEDLSGVVIEDDVFMRLLTFPNVLVTAHQAFFTEDAMRNIAETTLANITAFETGEGEMHRV